MFSSLALVNGDRFLIDAHQPLEVDSGRVFAIELHSGLLAHACKPR